jgi:hypothetical protein
MLRNRKFFPEPAYGIPKENHLTKNHLNEKIIINGCPAHRHGQLCAAEKNTAAPAPASCCSACRHSFSSASSAALASPAPCKKNQGQTAATTTAAAAAASSIPEAILIND